MGMEKKEPKRDQEKIEAVLKILKKQAPLTVKQEKFCNDGCVERFLRVKGDSVKKAAKHLRAVLSWRESVGADHLIADEFSAELAEGLAYVAGHDDDSRPVMVFRIKQDHPKFHHSHKSYVRLLVFTLEVAISSTSRFVDQFVLLFDASFFRSASAFLNVYMGTLKLIADFYPARLHRAFVVDPPSLFSYLWKGVRPFVDLWAATSLVSSLDFEDSLEDVTFTAYPRTPSLRFDPSPNISRAGGGGSTSSRFSFTVSTHFDSLKPWYLSTTTTASPSLIGASPATARSFSFASPGARSALQPRGSVPSTPLGQRTPLAPVQPPRTPRPSFLQSPAMMFFRRDKEQEKKDKEKERGREAFAVYLRFYRRPYDEMVYRAKMRPPLGGLISIVAPQGKQRRCHVVSQHHHQQQHHHHQRI